MTQIVAPMRGMFARKGVADTKQSPGILSLLASGTQLSLQPEPDNPYDPNAIQVHVAIDELELIRDKIDELLPAFGLDPDEFWEQESLFLGYVGKEFCEAIFSALAGEPNHKVSLGFAPDGKPTVILEA